MLTLESITDHMRAINSRADAMKVMDVPVSMTSSMRSRRLSGWDERMDGRYDSTRSTQTIRGSRKYSGYTFYCIQSWVWR